MGPYVPIKPDMGPCRPTWARGGRTKTASRTTLAHGASVSASSDVGTASSTTSSLLPKMGTVKSPSGAQASLGRAAEPCIRGEPLGAHGGPPRAARRRFGSNPTWLHLPCCLTAAHGVFHHMSCCSLQAVSLSTYSRGGGRCFCTSLGPLLASGGPELPRGPRCGPAVVFHKAFSTRSSPPPLVGSPTPSAGLTWQMSLDVWIGCGLPNGASFR